MKLSLSLFLVSILHYQCQLIPNHYIVTLDQTSRSSFRSKMDSVSKLMQLRNTNENQILQEFELSLHGFYAKLDNKMVEIMKSLPEVKAIEHDKVVQIAAEQKNSEWNLARITQRSKVPENGPYTYRYDDKAGEGVNIYVLDTGININHTDFKGRASWGVTIPKGLSNQDKNGHGTHCAGTAGGSRFGVAKKAKLIAVKVLGDNGFGNNADTIGGIEWVMKNKNGRKGNIMSISIEGEKSEAQERVVNNAVKCGVIVVVAAGNKRKDACDVSPGSAELAITVAATNIYDDLWVDSNYGKCVDILAPGESILSDHIGNNTATEYYSGTSMACPHVSGVAAIFLSQGVPVNQVEKKLKDIATKDHINELPGDTVNLLLYNGYSPY